MQTDKYYTPSIEEFHVGFECEMQTIKDHWVCTSIVIEHFKHLTRWLDERNVRVKYLDETDFIDMGFVESKLRYSNDSIFSKSVESGFNTGYHANISIISPNFITISYKTFGSYDTEEININAIINNRSELKRFFAQLNIK